jgi:hypothetical protein
MSEVDVFHMLIMQRHERREKKQQRVYLYNVVWEWEVRERDLYPRPITTKTQVILRDVGLLKHYEKATSLNGHSGLLVHMIRRWDFHR